MAEPAGDGTAQAAVDHDPVTAVDGCQPALVAWTSDGVVWLALMLRRRNGRGSWRATKLVEFPSRSSPGTWRSLIDSADHDAAGDRL